MAAFLTQKASNTAIIASVTATFSNAPQAGNLLVAAVTANVGVGSISISGWSTGTSIAVGVAGGLVIFYKVSAGNETSVTASATLATLLDLHIFEYDGIDNASPLDKTSTTADSGSGVTSRASGTTATLTQANELGFAAIAQAGNNGGGASWTNSFIAETTTTDLMTADIIVNATTALSTTGSWTTSQRAAGAIVTFFGETGDSYGLKTPLKPLTPNVNFNNPLTDELVLALPFFERGGTNDLEIINRLLFAFNGTLTWVSDLYGSSLKFDGSSGYLSNSNTIYQVSAFSIFALINPTGSGSRTILADNGNSGRQFRLNSSGNLELLKENVASIGTSTAALTNGNWYSVMVSYDSSGNYVFYINGAKSGSGTSAQTFSFNSLFVGKQTVNEYFSGQIAEVLMWKNRIITAQEVNQLYTNPWQIYTQPGFYQSLNNFTIPPGSKSNASQSISQPLNFDSAMSV